MTNLIGKKVTVKKGDKVKIRENFWEIDSIDFTPLNSMKKMAGNIYVVDYVHEDGDPHINDYYWDRAWIEPYKRDMNNLQQGDVIVGKNGDRCEILDVHGRVVDISGCNDFDSAGVPYTKEELIKEGYTLEGQEETVEEIVIDGKRYDKKEVEERIKELKSK